MLHRDYEGQLCSAARTLELIGERWTILIVRDVLTGYRRFDQLTEHLGIARNVLTNRLRWLVEEGILEKRAYQERPERYEYFLTEKGLDLWPVLVALIGFGDKHLTGPEGPPLVLEHKECGGRVNDRRICEKCDAQLSVREVKARPGPGAEAAHAVQTSAA